MENIRRSIKLFFVKYGELLFRTLGIIFIVIMGLKFIEYTYIENLNNDLKKEAVLEEERIKTKENIQSISEFLDYCNNMEVKKAYSMLSDQCIKEKYETVEKFKSEYIDKFFKHKKEYDIEKNENGLYKIIIMEDILKAGSIDNRKSVTNYFRLENEVLGVKIYIER